MTKGERTRQFIIEKTAPLFNKKGFEGTTLRDLTSSTRLTKGAIYGNFSDKDQIAAEAFRYSVKKVKSMVKARLDRVSTPKQKLAALLEFYREYVFNPPVPGGCPLLNSAIEADDLRTSGRKVVAREIFETVKFIEKLLRSGVRMGEFRSDINARQLAYMFFCSVEGALMYARVERSSEPMDIVVKHCKNILEEISI